MIQIVYIPGDRGFLSAPMYFCDHCNRVINESHTGVYLWDGLAKEARPIYFAHVGPCHVILEKKLGLYAWQELGRLSHFLGHNYRDRCSYQYDSPEMAPILEAMNLK